MAIWAITLLFLAASVMSLLAMQTTVSYIGAADREKIRTIEQVASDIKTWYKANAFSIDAVSSVVPHSVAVSDRWGMTVLSSERFHCGNAVHARRYAVVLPGPDGIETTIDRFGNVIYGRHDTVRVIDGCKIQSQLLDESRKKSFAVALALENYFKALRSQEQFGSARNYFTSSICGGWGAIACSDDGRNNVRDILMPVLGISDSDSRDAWGNIMHFDNLSANVSSRSHPFSSRVGFTTPWGDIVWTKAAGTI